MNNCCFKFNGQLFDFSGGEEFIEVANYASLPAVGETSKIYVTLDDNKLYRWTGSTYVEVSPNTIPIYLQISCSDLITPLTVGNTKSYFRSPTAFTLTEVRASLVEAQTDGDVIEIDITRDGISLFGKVISIENQQTTSLIGIPPEILISDIRDDDELKINIINIGDGTAKGLIVTLIGTK